MAAPHAYALVFPGQGSQRPGMLDALPVTDGIDELLAHAETLVQRPLRAIARGEDPAPLTDTRIAQVLIYLADVAWGRALIERGARPSALAGHSLGEYAALAVAGVFSLTSGLELIVRRATLMAACAERHPGGMIAALGGTRDLVMTAIEGIPGVWVANDNAPGQIVISGTHAGLEAATAALLGVGVRRVVPLAVSGAFHSPLMTEAAEAFQEVLEETTFLDARIPIYQNTDPTPSQDGDVLKARLATQIERPVRWTETMHALRDAGVRLLIECGPGSVIAGLARRVEGIEGISCDTEGLDAVMEVLA